MVAFVLFVKMRFFINYELRITNYELRIENLKFRI
jgi:hypothetical protein